MKFAGTQQAASLEIVSRKMTATLCRPEIVRDFVSTVTVSKQESEQEADEDEFAQFIGPAVVAEPINGDPEIVAVRKALNAWKDGINIGTRKLSLGQYNLNIYDSHPVIRKLAYTYLATPATSASSERLFSIMKQIDMKSNSRLSLQHWKMLAFLKANRE